MAYSIRDAVNSPRPHHGLHAPPRPGQCVVAERLVAFADGLATRVHTIMERDARYVDVTMLDVTGCDDGHIFAARIAERIDGSVGGYATGALARHPIPLHCSGGDGAGLLDAS